MVVESSVLTSDRESDLENPHVRAGEVEPDVSSIDSNPPGQFREENPGHVNLRECVDKGETRQPPLCSFWRRAFAEFGSVISIAHAVQRARDVRFTFARSFKDIVVGSLMKETTPCLQRGHGMDPGGLPAAAVTVFVEHR
jgi:hypothetical protein